MHAAFAARNEAATEPGRSEYTAHFLVHAHQEKLINPIKIVCFSCK